MVTTRLGYTRILHTYGEEDAKIIVDLIKRFVEVYGDVEGLTSPDDKFRFTLIWTTDVVLVSSVSQSIRLDLEIQLLYNQISWLCG